ncbi:cilia- and flagella-associated protein 298-B-like [Ornithodoros turicata]|uniref:cilia- and flagella-associated protein 298-B-like n=1 Tax=Ornithodoros turicata TaxID=34597 RepID=UPI003138D734
MKLKVKSGTVTFLVESSSETLLSELLPKLANIYRGIMHIQHLCSEIEKLANHMMAEKSCQSKSCAFSPQDAAQTILKVTTEAQARVSNSQQESGTCVSESLIFNTVEMLKNTVSATALDVESSGKILESLSAKNLEMYLPDEDVHLWWAGKELTRGKKLSDFVGKNEKTTILAVLGPRAPIKEMGNSSPAQADFLLSQLKRQHEVQFLEASTNVDTKSLQKAVQGLGEIKWKP